MDSVLTQYTKADLEALTFDDLPSATETAGKGVHLGKRFRAIEANASDRDGVEHRYRLTITRFDTPAEQAKAKWEAAEKRLLTLQNQDTEKVKCFQSYTKRLSSAFEKAEALHTAMRIAKRKHSASSPDKVSLKDFGRTSTQIERDRASLMVNVANRPSASFLNFLLEGTDVSANGSQRELIADFLEGQSSNPPFYFMGHQWRPVLEKAGAITTLASGEYQLSGEKLKQAYQSYCADKSVTTLRSSSRKTYPF